MIALSMTGWALLYVVAGLSTLFVLVRLGLRTAEDIAELSDNLGRIVVFSLLGWPYILFVWVFSWPLWLKKL